MSSTTVHALLNYLKVIVVGKMKDKRMGSLNEWFILHGDWRGSRDVILRLFYIQKGKGVVPFLIPFVVVYGAMTIFFWDVIFFCFFCVSL